MPSEPSPCFPGPPALGRGVIIAPNNRPPRSFEAVPRYRLDDEVLTQPAPLTTVLHHHWLRREPVVIELAVDPKQLRAPQVETRAPYLVGDAHTFHLDRLRFLTWANNYDLRAGDPVWWHGVLARRHAGAGPSSTGDIRLPDGRDALVDGGPRGPITPGPITPEPVAGRSRPARDADLPPLVHRESVGLRRLTVSGDAPPADELAPDQLAAVAHRAGPARIIAPAGSGKTRVLTARLRHLLRERRVEPELVTAVAYNTRAAAEMRARTGELGASIRTLHSLGLWIVRRHERREVITERDQRSILDGLIRVGRVPNQDPFAPYLEALAEVRLGLRDPFEVETRRGDVDGFSEVFDRYREQLALRRVLDFDEQIFRAVELLLTEPQLRREVQQVGTHLLVDEFQDLTPAFLLLVRLVAGPPMQVFAVGDDDQTIYRYAGASPDFLVRFDRWFPGAEHHALEVNYRCPAPVVQAAVTLLSHNRERVPKTIRVPANVPGTEATLTPTTGPAVTP